MYKSRTMLQLCGRRSVHGDMYEQCKGVARHRSSIARKGVSHIVPRKNGAGRNRRVRWREIQPCRSSITIGLTKKVLPYLVQWLNVEPVRLVPLLVIRLCRHRRRCRTWHQNYLLDRKGVHGCMDFVATVVDNQIESVLG